MRLFATPLSHFSRKVRLLLDHLEVECEIVDVGNVADAEPAMFAGNPLMSVPVLQDGDVQLIESDLIAAHLARKFDPEDRYGVLTDDPDALNMRSVMNGVMASEVRLILAERTGLDTTASPYFDKARHVIEAGLAWLEERAAFFTPNTPRYREFHLASLWDHLAYYETVPMSYPLLADTAATLGARPVFQETAPRVLRPKPQ